MSNTTLNETADRIADALRRYIEATYHIADPFLVDQRRALLKAAGVISQPPFIESTPRYQSPRRFEALAIPGATKELLLNLSEGSDPVLFNPPYTHQAEALEAAGRGQSLLVMTGTGSGKTESFLMPILSKLATEASSSPEVFREQHAFRALVLYPMNALVNDQLGRLRRLFGDAKLRRWFEERTGRPARFARYTSRTLYPGVRSPKKDGVRLKGIEEFYLEKLDAAASADEENRRRNQELIDMLKKKGKWPGKPDLRAWYGEKNQRWQDAKSGDYQRAVTLPKDVELLTRHEVQAHCPDVLITNYSMLEYMLIRPVERPIFEQTRRWLKENPEESLLVVLDEAHLYRGATGSEVALLIRRLCARLGVGPDRLQAISTSASFSSKGTAKTFASNLTGVPEARIDVFTGDLKLMECEGIGGESEADVLARIDLSELAPHHPRERRLATLAEFFEFRGIDPGESVERSLYEALHDFAPLALLVNTTMRTASGVSEMAGEVFPNSPEFGEAALSNLAGMASIARLGESEAGLLSARAHMFFRGLPGLWICVDPECSAIGGDGVGRCAGKLYPEPRERCECGARVFELFTCRDCGATYCRAYSDDVEKPAYLWSEPGVPLTQEDSPRGSDSLEPLDILLEFEVDESGDVEPAELDIKTGRLNGASEKNRLVFLKPNRVPPRGGGNQYAAGQFVPCGACGSKAAFGRSSVQDHQTKGDEPFYALVSEQFAVQPPTREFSASHPAQGRKLLTFADSRQSAARLASRLGANSLRDAIRPLLVSGYRTLESDTRLATGLHLGDLYVALLIGATRAGVTFTGPLQQSEARPPFTALRDALFSDGTFDASRLFQAYNRFRDKRMPEFVLEGLIHGLSHEWFGLESLAMASVREWDLDFPAGLPGIPGVAEKADEKAWLVRAWLGHLFRDRAFDLRDIPSNRYHKDGVRPKPKLAVTGSVERGLQSPSAIAFFKSEWLPKLQRHFCPDVKAGGYLVDFSTVALDASSVWGVCTTCQTPQRPHPSQNVCRNCGRRHVRILQNPDTDPVFSARKGFYRGTIDRAERGELQILNAAEHTAQLGSPDGTSVFSVAERNELLFQDVPIAEVDTPSVDVLSCTTTMEVGIDIGSLAAVSLRNMPPRRSNYQQRAGRAGRRGTSVATVLAFANTESHDSHHFRNPSEMIRGRVVDPILNLDNVEVARRHIRAYLLQNYQLDRVPADAATVNSNLFSVLGTVLSFKDSTSLLNRVDLEAWLTSNEAGLKTEVRSWLPSALGEDAVEDLVSNLVSDLLQAIDAAIGQDPDEDGGDDADEEDGNADPGDNISNLLDRLLYKGILPRYAFPTDVVTFHVFSDDSTRFRPVFKYSPSQGLTAALSQYAPGKTVHIDGSDYHCGAIYTPNSDERRQAWDNRFLYFECGDCGYAKLLDRDKAPKNGRLRCDACGGPDSLGPGRSWMRPPGFAHPHGEDAGIGSGKVIPNSYPTRAKLKAPSDMSTPERLTDRIRTFAFREDLLVTNSGPRSEGYSYCHRCGRIEPTATNSGILSSPHRHPTPDQRDDCPGGIYSPRVTLGTTFLTDLLIVQFDLTSPVKLPPKSRAFHVALRTVAEAIVLAACRRFDLEPSELNAEYRPALTNEGKDGEQVEIYLYDTLPGGAGYTARIRRELMPILEDALALLRACDSDCDTSCYRCLRSYQNKFEHQLLDRFIGAAFLEHALKESPGDLDSARITAASEVLVAELERSLPESVSVKMQASIDIDGMGEVRVPILVTKEDGTRAIVSVHSPIRLGQPLEGELQRIADETFELVRPVNELLVRENLPAAVQLVREEIGG